MDNTDIIVTHLVDYGTIAFNWRDAVFVAVALTSLVVAISFTVVFINKLLTKS